MKECLNLMENENVSDHAERSNSNDYIVSEFLRAILSHNNDQYNNEDTNINMNNIDNIENIINKNDRKINFEFEINEKYTNLSHRLKSYRFWPKYYHISAMQMAKAGFYYLGVGDYVKCICCGIVLNDWKESISPAREHINQASSCSYVKLFLDDGQSYLSEASSREKDEFDSKKKRNSQRFNK